MHNENLIRCMLLLALPAIVIATGCAHQPTLNRAARPISLVTAKCPTLPIDAAESSSKFATSIPAVTVETPLPKPSLVKSTPPAKSALADPLPSNTRNASILSSDSTWSRVQQTSASEMKPQRQLDLQAARLPSPIRSNDLPTGEVSTANNSVAKPARSYGFKDFARDDAPAVSVKVPPSMRQTPDAKWGTTSLTSAAVEKLPKAEQGTHSSH
jgi:hypothetical protein